MPRLRHALPLMFLLGLCLRGPTLELPLEGGSARLASAAAVLRDGGPLLVPGQAPLLPALTAGLLTWGGAPTPMLRWLDAFFVACLGPLLVLLALRLDVPRHLALFAGLLLTLHPLGLAGGGGIAPGTGGLAAALLLLALWLLASPGRAAMRGGACVVLLLCLADASALALAPPLLWLVARRETAPRVQTAFLMLGGGLLLAAPFTWWTWAGGADIGSSARWLAAACVGLLLPGLPFGLAVLARGPLAARAWLAASGAAALLALLGGPASGVCLLPLAVLAGIMGSARLLRARLLRRWRTQLVGGLVGGALLTSVGLVWGGLQTTLWPAAPAAAGRLDQLREVMHSAALAAGHRGWIVLAVGAGHPEEQASLADLAPGHWTWVERAGATDEVAARRLRVFPAAAFESGGSVAVVARAGRGGGIHTFDGAGIFHEEVVREVGPYVVLRASRP